MGRLRSATLRSWFARALAPVLRATEVRRVTGATTLALGFATVVALFPRQAAVAGLLYAGFADAAGAIVGRAAGAHRFRSGKTLEGTIAFAVVAFFVGWAAAGLGLPAAAIVAVALASLEAAPLPIDDNLFVPLAGSTLAYLASVLR